MKENEVNITAEQAQASLDAVKKINTDAVKTQRPPLWFLILSSAAYGMMSFSYSSMEHENMWAMGLIISGAVFFILFLFLYYSYRLMGIKLKMWPTSKSSTHIYAIYALLFGVVFAGARELTVIGFDWVAYAGGAICAIGFFSMTYLYPTGEPLNTPTSKQ